MWKYNKSFSFKAKSSYHSQALDVSAEGLSDPFVGKAQPILMKKKLSWPHQNWLSYV